MFLSFAESVPNTNGTFACQIIRMIKSGLVGRPEDDKILINGTKMLSIKLMVVYIWHLLRLMGWQTLHLTSIQVYTSHLPDNFTDSNPSCYYCG